ncbi:MAG: hypothetical protein HRT83_01670 [Hyphomicrobiaceae bacterium]|nr:hypothetical protein [Hyphomicrobiaceae bacterium]
MLDKIKQRRGRPKGSGIDDWKRLSDIAFLIDSNSELRVTTAIKKLGFHDPSTIRRLRDKFKLNKNALKKKIGIEYRANSFDKDRSLTDKKKYKLASSNVIHKIKVTHILNNSETRKHQYFKRAKDALAEYEYLADTQSSLVSSFKAKIARCLLQEKKNYIATH